MSEFYFKPISIFSSFLKVTNSLTKAVENLENDFAGRKPKKLLEGLQSKETEGESKACNSSIELHELRFILEWQRGLFNLVTGFRQH